MNRFFSPRRISFRVFLGAFAWLFFVVRALAGSNAVSMDSDANARINLTTVNSVWDGLGWLPVTIRIDNYASEEQSWDFTFTNSGNVRLATEASVSVPARSARDVTVFIAGPGASTASMSYVLATVSGPGVTHGNNTSVTDRRSVDQGYIAVAAGPIEEVRRMVAGMPKRPSYGSSTVEPFEIELIDPLRWPADWRVWSSFSSIVLSQDEFNALDGARRNALREWVAQGGRLWLRQRDGVADVKSETQVGTGAIYTKLDRLLSISTDRSLRVAPWTKNGPLLTDGDRDEWALTKPIASLIFFLVIFGIVVGPLNVFFFAPAAKRHRLFITVPIISVAASLLLGVVIVLVDGFGGSGVRRAQVVLVPGENKAVVFQQQVSRTGVLLSDGFSLPADTLIAVPVEKLKGTHELSRAGEKAGGAWFTSRASQVQDLRRITPTRARVELVDGGTGTVPPVVQSSLTTVLKEFSYIDSEGRIWTTKELPPGKKVALIRGSVSYRPEDRGYFRAQGGPSDLAPLNTHRSISWTDRETILYTGRLEAASQQ